MKNKTILIGTFVAIMTSGAVMAEFKYGSNYPGQALSGVDSVNSVHNDAVVGSAGEATKSAQFNKSQLLRCWQEGELIVAENGWTSMPDKSREIMSKGSSKMSAYDFGETFCLYLGE